MPDRPFRCLDEQVRHSFHFCYSDKVERDWTRSNTAYRESSPNEHPHVGAENSLQINHSPVSLPGSSFLENIFLFRSGKIFAQISHSRTILITFTPELDHIFKKNLKSLLRQIWLESYSKSIIRGEGWTGPFCTSWWWQAICLDRASD